MYGNRLPKILEPDLQNELLNEYAKNKDSCIRERLILHNLRLVKSISLKYKEGTNSLKNQEDLYHEGVIGLMAAIESYDPDKGSFSGHAVYRIKASITEYIRDKAQPLRVPARIYETLYKVDVFKEKYENQYYKKPTMIEISAALDIPMKRLKFILDIDRNVASLDSYITAEGETSLGEIIEDPESDFSESILSSIFVDETIEQFKHYLNESEFNVVVLSLGLNCKEHSYKEISELLEIPYKDIATIKTDCMRKLRRTGYMTRIKRELDEETIWYQSPSYDNVITKKSYKQSPVENIVMRRESNRKSLFGSFK